MRRHLRKLHPKIYEEAIANAQSKTTPSDLLASLAPAMRVTRSRASEPPEEEEAEEVVPWKQPKLELCQLIIEVSGK